MKLQHYIAVTIGIVSLAGCSNSTTSVNPGTMPPLGIHGTLWTTDWNKLNTLDGYYVQNADIPELRDSIHFVFTSDEQARIEHTADAVGFWSMPADIPVMSGLRVEPNSGLTTIRIKSETKDWTISWNGVAATGFASQISPLTDTIYAILHARKELHGMPPPALRD